MQRHAHARLHVQAQRLGRFDALDVEHHVAVERGEVAGFAERLDERAQQRPARAREALLPSVESASCAARGPSVMPRSVPRESGRCIT